MIRGKAIELMREAEVRNGVRGKFGKVGRDGREGEGSAWQAE